MKEHLGGLSKQLVPHRIVMSEVQSERVNSMLPWGILRAGYLTCPAEHVCSTVRILHWLSDKAERMVTAPFLPLFLESVDHQLVHFLLIQGINIKGIIRNRCFNCPLRFI